jgi:hypothetical protein
MSTYKQLLKEGHGIIKDDESVAKALISLSNNLPKTAPEITAVLSDEEIVKMDNLQKKIVEATKTNQDTATLKAKLGPLLLKVIGFGI